MSGYRYEYRFPVALPAPKDEVFRALTTRQALEAWFAEHADIELAEGGRFRFWGRHTVGTADRDAGKQTIVTLDPPNAIGFTWRLLERDTEVHWSLDEEAEVGKISTYLTVRHTFSTLPQITRAEAFIDDIWRIYTGCLCFFMHRKRDFFRPDFADDSPDVVSEIVIDAPPNVVFSALVTPEHISKWFPAPAPVVEPRVGGKYGFGFSYEVDGEMVEPPPMTILEYEPDARLAFTWPDWRGDESVPDQRVTWILEDLGDGRTRLRLVHSGFTRAADVSDYPFGWQEFLDKIRDVAASIQ